MFCITRRDFSVTLAAAVIPGGASRDGSPTVILEAVAGACLPARLTISACVQENLRGSFWELRTYTGAEPGLQSHLAQLFPSAGIRALLQETARGSLTYLIRFDSLAARDRAWTDLNTDPAWTGPRPRFASYHFALYRVA